MVLEFRLPFFFPHPLSLIDYRLRGDSGGGLHARPRPFTHGFGTRTKSPADHMGLPEQGEAMAESGFRIREDPDRGEKE